MAMEGKNNLLIRRTDIVFLFLFRARLQRNREIPPKWRVRVDDAQNVGIEWIPCGATMMHIHIDIGGRGEMRPRLLTIYTFPFSCTSQPATENNLEPANEKHCHS
jgi:hypothetical protein